MNTPIKSRIRLFLLISTLSVISALGFAGEETTATLTSNIILWGYEISFEYVLSWLLVPIAWAITEYAPVDDDTQPLIPFVVGALAGIIGHKVFGIDVVTAQLQFAAALSAGTMNGFIKKLIPWVVKRVRRSDEVNKPPAES